MLLITCHHWTPFQHAFAFKFTAYSFMNNLCPGILCNEVNILERCKQQGTLTSKHWHWPFRVFTATGTLVFFHPPPISSFLRSLALEDLRIFERRLKDSAVLSRGLRARMPIASARTTCPKAPAPRISPRMSLSSGNSQSGSYGRSLHCSRRLRSGSIWTQKNCYLNVELTTQSASQVLLHKSCSELLREKNRIVSIMSLT